MNDQLITDAGKKIMDASPVFGPLLIILGLVIVALVLWIRAILKDKDTRTDAHLADVRKYAAENEANRAALTANTEQLRANTQATTTLIEVVRDRERMRA
ncbi:hypothetical protein [Rhizobium sp. SSA_523]|uniref:hypothetical protein n=1 Tax=Rhizobium sp. SSA_523 TaxID=2952477 RepID=UPI0020907195|nr:hypothetical protein [Rhizobium sp. SSA_523]MCO5730062.1 hypothetical protein [Rhizobium sp. SSA_523]WKC25128.1 hypothetical protein QTJ18_14160 [Rhizobium sp. SSA_523]